MKIRNFLPLLVVLFSMSLLSCSGNSKEKQTMEQPPKAEKFQLVKGFDYVHLIPDSLRTPEQKKLFFLLQNVLKQNLVIENNHFTFKLSKDEFLEKGIPQPYYDLIMNDAKESNAWIDSAGIKDVDKMLEEAFQKFEMNSIK